MVDGVKGAPERGQGLFGGGDGFVVAAGVGMFVEPGAPRFAVGFVGFFVDGEVGQRGGFVDSVEFAEAVDFGAGDFGNLRFVGVKRGHGISDGAIAADFAEGGYDVLRTGESGAASDVVFADSDGRGKIAPELWVRASRIFFLGEIFHHGVTERAFGARG